MIICDITQRITAVMERKMIIGVEKIESLQFLANETNSSSQGVPSLELRAHNL